MIEKPVSRLIQTLEASSFSLIGSPGSCGLGVEALQTYASAIKSAQGDFMVTLGGVAPLGRDPYYRLAADFIDAIRRLPMYVVPGTGDGDAFTHYFGHRDKAVITEEYILILLDNAGGSFSDSTLSFLRGTLAIANVPNIIVAFHSPPPNRFSGISMRAEEWAKFEEAAGVWRKRITMLVAGGSGVYFEDEVDGLTLIGAGGGAATTAVPGRAAESMPRLVEFRLDQNGRIVHHSRPIASLPEPDRDNVIRDHLKRAFESECQAHSCHVLDAEEAERRGRANLAKLFRATAESRLRHARNLRRVLYGVGTPGQLMTDAVESTDRESEQIQYARADAARARKDILAQRVFQDVAASEIVNTGLLEKAVADLARSADVEPGEYQVCSSCGVVFTGFLPPDNCSECGAPGEMIREIL